MKEENKETQRHIPMPYELFGDEGLSKTGWAGLLVPLYEKAEKFNEKMSERRFFFSQIKEKWSSLRIYHYGADEEIEREIDMCENASNHICMRCGSPFRVGKNTGGYIETICEECAKNIYNMNPYRVYIWKEKGEESSKMCYTVAKNKKEARIKLAETLVNCFNISEVDAKKHVKEKYVLFDTYKQCDWKLYYDSVQITPIILIALRLQKIWYRFETWVNHVRFLIYKFKNKINKNGKF
jgi:hypothetical protein